jgi:hypothetical protein
MMRSGLIIAAVGLVMAIVIISGGGKPNMLWMAAAGLVLAGIGYARRVLYALERR